MRNGVPDHFRQQAKRLDRDRAGLERTGARAASRIGRQARLAALKAFERGQDPARAPSSAVDTMQNLMVDAMVAGHLKGRSRAGKSAKQDMVARLKFRTVYDGAVETLRKAQQLTRRDIIGLRDTYSGQVAGTLEALNLSIDEKVRAALVEIGEQGLHSAAATARLKQAFDAAGITPENSYTLENLFRTHTQLAYSAGRWDVLTSEPVDDILWGFQYVSVGDDRVRPAHEAMDGVRLPKDDPFWRDNFPPNGFSCRCAAIEIFKGDANARADRIVAPGPREIDGAVVEPRAEPGFRFNPGELFGADMRTIEKRSV